MPCYKPIKAIGYPGPGGKMSISFKRRPDCPPGAKALVLPCGRCTGCRLENSRKWAIRLTKEARCHEKNSFLTLTYAKPPLTKGGLPTLVLEDIQLFMKRLRKQLDPTRVRFFQCGEYGEKNQRPHHHVILFGHDFSSDRKQIEDTPSGFPQWESPTLTEIWGLGRATISEVSFDTMAYVARYAMKKIYGASPKALALAERHYQGRKKEFITMSRNPGIGSQYYEEFKDEMYPQDSLVPELGRPRCKPPRYFDKQLEKDYPHLFKEIKKNREEKFDFWTDPNSTDTRLAERERVKIATIKQLKRNV